MCSDTAHTIHAFILTYINVAIQCSKKMDLYEAGDYDAYSSSCAIGMVGISRALVCALSRVCTAIADSTGVHVA